MPPFLRRHDLPQFKFTCFLPDCNPAPASFAKNLAKTVDKNGKTTGAPLRDLL